MPLNLTDDKSTLVQVMAWCRQATSHYLSQCWPRSMSPNGVTRPQWVKSYTAPVLVLPIMRRSMRGRVMTKLWTLMGGGQMGNTVRVVPTWCRHVRVVSPSWPRPRHGRTRHVTFMWHPVVRTHAVTFAITVTITILVVAVRLVRPPRTKTRRYLKDRTY